MPSRSSSESNPVRALFLLGAFLMLITLPIISNSVSVPIFFSLFAIVAVEFVAGLTAPTLKAVAVVNALMAMIAMIAFEFLAVQAHVSDPANGSLFWINQILAVIFFFAFYYASKVFRRAFFGR